MKEYTVEFYVKENGVEPVKDFITTLEPKMIAKILRIIDLLEENGTLLNMPYSKHLEDGIYEIRAKVGSDISRILYFFISGKRIILTNGFVKKTQKTPRVEIEKAKSFREDFFRRNAK